MSKSRWLEMVDAYVLDALEADEKAAFEDALASDPELVERVARAHEATLALAEGLPEARPPAELRARVLAAARDARDGGSGHERTAAPEPPTSAERGTTGIPSAVPWLLLAASVAGLAFLGSENASLRGDADLLADQLESVRGQLTAANASVARLDSLALAVSGPGVRMATLSGDNAPELRLVWNPDRALLLVAATNLPQLAEGRTYQLWGIGGSDAPVSLGTFDTDAQGTALATLAGVPTGAYEVSAVTDEPVGGSPQPTTTPFLVGSWSASED